jgi:hypothetical protein
VPAKLYRLAHSRPAPHDRANRDGAATLACSERDDLRILNVVGVASVATGAGAGSPQSVLRSSKKVSIELLAITEPIRFRNRGLKSVGETFVTVNLGLRRRRLRAGAAEYTDRNQ